MATIDQRETEQHIPDTKNTLTKLDQIAAKNKCLRVQFLDWLAVKVKHYGDTWSANIQAVSNKIDAPCVIKVDYIADEVPLSKAEYLYAGPGYGYINIKEMKAKKVLRDMIKSNPEANRLSLGQLFSENADQIHAPNEEASEYIKNSPEINYLKENHFLLLPPS